MMDPTEVIQILAEEIAAANSREALGGYFDHLAENADLQAAINTYAGVNLGAPQDDYVDRQAEEHYRAHSSSITGILEGP